MDEKVNEFKVKLDALLKEYGFQIRPVIKQDIEILQVVDNLEKKEEEKVVNNG